MGIRSGPQIMGDMKKRKVAKAKITEAKPLNLPSNKIKTWATGPQLKAIGKKAKSIVLGKKK